MSNKILLTDDDIDGVPLPSNNGSCFLGHGLDVINAEGPHISELKLRIFNDNVYSKHVDINPDSDTNSLSVESKSVEKVFKSFDSGFSAGTGKSVPFFSASLSVKYGESRSMEKETSFYNGCSTTSAAKHLLTVPAANIVESVRSGTGNTFLTDAFLNFITHEDNPEKIFEAYGTHILTDISMGSRVEISASCESSAISTSSSLKSALDASSAWVSGSTSVNWTQGQKSTLANSTINVLCRGGESCLFTAISYIDLGKALQEWRKTLFSQKERYAISRVHGTIPIWDFFEGATQQKLIQHFESMALDAQKSISEHFTYKSLVGGPYIIQVSSTNLVLGSCLPQILKAGEEYYLLSHQRHEMEQQQFMVEDAGDNMVYIASTTDPNWVLQPEGCGAAIYTRVKLAKRGKTQAQKWKLVHCTDNKYFIEHPYSGFVMDLTNAKAKTANDFLIHPKHPSNAWNQLFIFDTV